MKQVFVLLLSATIFLLQSCSRVEKSTPLTEQAAGEILAKYEKDFNSALAGKSRSSLERLMSDRFIFISPEGKIISKKTMIDIDLMACEPKFDEFKPTVEQIFTSDNMIVTVGYFVNKGTLNGKDISGSYRNLEMYQKNKDGWQMVISQLTKMEQESK